MRAGPARGVFAQRDFRLLWGAQAVSSLGGRITRTALPVMAVLSIESTPLGLALLAVISEGPGVLMALVSGGFVDRSRKRPILVAADLVRFAAVASVPIAAFAGSLALGHLFAVAAVVGAAGALFRIADQAYLPALVGVAHLVQGNKVIEATEGVAEIAGPGVAGVLIQILTAPVAVLFDALTYVYSAVLLSAIRQREVPAADDASPGVWRDLVTGFRVSWEHPLVRPLLLTTSATAYFGGFFTALYMLFVLRVLALDPATVGVVIAMGGIGALAGAALARPLARRLGIGPSMIVALALNGIGGIFIPAATGPPWLVLIFLFGHQLIADGFMTTYRIQAVSLRQTILPLEVLGRSNAAFHAVSGTALPLGAVTAGGLALVTGVRAALWIGMGCGLAAPLLLLPLRRLRALPTAAPTSGSPPRP